MSDEDLQYIDECLLPPQARELAKIIGLPDTITLLKAYGGHRLRFPQGKKDDTLLTNIISPEAYSKLCKSRFAGQRLTLPKVDKILDQIRNEHIRSLRSVPKSEMARQYNLTERHVQRLRNDCDENPTLDMFDEPVG